MGMSKKDLIEIEKKLDGLPLWKIIIYCSNIEKELVGLKKQGLSSNDCKIHKIRWIRSAYRNILIDKLNKWKKNPNLVNDIMDFSSVQEDNMQKEIL